MFKNRKNTSITTTLPNFYSFLSEKLPSYNLEELPVNTEEFSSGLGVIFENTDDFIYRKINIQNKHCYIYYLNGLSNQERLEKIILMGSEKIIGEEEFINNLNKVEHMEPMTWEECVKDCLSGRVIVHLEGKKPISISVQQKEKRSLTEPTTEYQVYGPKIGFIEDSRVNIALMRRFIQDPRLKVKEYSIGSLSNSHVGLIYLEEYVDKDVLKLVMSSLEQVEIENLIDGAQLAKEIVDFPNSVFPQIYQTERPDIASFSLSKGRIVIFVENSTFCIVLPVTLFTLLEISTDNFRVALDMTFLRALRIVSIFVATILPGLYISLVGYHPELLPTTLALTIADSRNNIPFPVFTEAFLMIFALDVLVEASMRLPSFVGQTIGIVGGLVIGQAAVQAGLVSTTMIIVSSSTAIASFTLPTWDLISSWRLCRYLLLVCAGVLGVYGLVLGIAFITLHLCNLRSFGHPYLKPATP